MSGISTKEKVKDTDQDLGGQVGTGQDMATFSVFSFFALILDQLRDMNITIRAWKDDHASAMQSATLGGTQVIKNYVTLLRAAKHGFGGSVTSGIHSIFVHGFATCMRQVSKNFRALQAATQEQPDATHAIEDRLFDAIDSRKWGSAIRTMFALAGVCTYSTTAQHISRIIDEMMHDDIGIKYEEEIMGMMSGPRFAPANQHDKTIDPIYWGRPLGTQSSIMIVDVQDEKLRVLAEEPGSICREAAEKFAQTAILHSNGDEVLVRRLLNFSERYTLAAHAYDKKLKEIS